MKRKMVVWVVALSSACASSSENKREPAQTPAAQADTAAPVKTPQEQADAFLAAYYEELGGKEKAAALAYWTAANSGKPEDYETSAKADLDLRMLHSDTARYAEIQRLLGLRAELQPLSARSLEVAELAFKGNQLPKEVLEAMSKQQADIEQSFKTFRPEVGGKKLTNNDLLEVLGKDKDAKKRQAAWEASKAVGGQVAAKIVELAKVRNQAAKTLGFADFWDMSVRLQEHDPATLLAIFDELEKLTDGPFKDMKGKMDAEVAKKFKVKPAQLMPWHYTNPFFQDAPPPAGLDTDEFYKGKAKEDVVAIAQKFYADIGLDMAAIAARSDLYDREGKDQHAFCITIDRKDDVRTLLNVKPNEEWTSTMLHEMGHALYYTGINQELPYNLRESAHIFTTEGIAMLFGALSRNPVWMAQYVGADEKKVKKAESSLYEHRRREQLIFVRWGLVMLRFEKELYANPEQDLNKLWWDLVERYQGLARPKGREAMPDWAAKTHFTSAPVYYHNYVLGELFAAQLRTKLATLAAFTGPAVKLSFNGRKDFGDYLTANVFKPGMTQKWPDFVTAATGAPLSPAAFGAEVAAPVK